MNAERLLQSYERIADAPDAIARLRRFILDLAVRGKLVPQDANDEPAEVLHAQLAKRFAEHPSAKGRGRRSEIAAGLIDQPPYASPAGWLWVRMGELGETNIGLTYSPNDLCADGIPVLRSNNVQEGKIALDDLVRVRSEPKPSVMVHQGDMLICARNGSRALVGKAALIDRLPEPMAFGAFMAIFRSPINPYLHMFLTSPVFRQVIDEVNTNTINQITQANLRSTLVPLPPLAEQHRIIAKVDELMGLCDRLEAARAGRETVRDRLAAVGLARLNAPDPETFQASARFVVDALPALTTRPDQIKRIRQSILNLAVRGKLVPQNPTEEPASELLKRIAKEKARLVKSGEIKKAEAVADFTASIPDFLAPSGWAITNLQSICNSVTDGDHLPPPKAATGIPFLVIGNVRTQRIVFEGSRFVPQSYYDALDPIRRPRSGDLLYTLVGSYGIPVIVRDDQAFCVQRHIGIFRPSALVDVKFLARAMESRFVFDQATACATGIAQKTVPLSGLRKLLIPLPPLAEQHRIVAKVDALMALCDRLEASLTATAATRRSLLDALLAEALAPAKALELQAAE
jgi:type I restriction enzyme S subunit